LTENNGDVSENGEQLDRTARPGRKGAGDADVASQRHKSTKPNGGNKSWFSDTYSAWPLRRIGAAFREERGSTSGAIKIGARNAADVTKQRKAVI